jgi:hypothetical protein
MVVVAVIKYQPPKPSPKSIPAAKTKKVKCKSKAKTSTDRIRKLMTKVVRVSNKIQALIDDETREDEPMDEDEPTTDAWAALRKIPVLMCKQCDYADEYLRMV